MSDFSDFETRELPRIRRVAADVTLDVDSDHDVDPDLARLQRAFAPNKTFARKEDFLSELKQLCLLLDRNYGCANGNNTTRHMVFCSTVSGNKNPLKIDGACPFHIVMKIDPEAGGEMSVLKSHFIHTCSAEQNKAGRRTLLSASFEQVLDCARRILPASRAGSWTKALDEALSARTLTASNSVKARAISVASIEAQGTADDEEFASLVAFVQAYDGVDDESYGTYTVDDVGHFVRALIVHGFGARAVSARFLANIHSLDLSHIAGRIDERVARNLIYNDDKEDEVKSVSEDGDNDDEDYDDDDYDYDDGVEGEHGTADDDGVTADAELETRRHARARGKHAKDASSKPRAGSRGRPKRVNIQYGRLIALVGRTYTAQRVVLALGIVPTESSEHVDWFLRESEAQLGLREAYGVVNFLMDRGAAINGATKAVFGEGNCFIAHCYPHFERNVVDFIGSSVSMETKANIIQLVRLAHCTTIPAEFHEALSTIKGLSERTFTYLQAHPKEQWASSFVPFNTLGNFTSNDVESLYGTAIEWKRRAGVFTTFVKALTGASGTAYRIDKAYSSAKETFFATAALGKQYLEHLKAARQHYRVEQRLSTAQVIISNRNHQNRLYTIDLRDVTNRAQLCSSGCNRVSVIPCVHVVFAIRIGKLLDGDIKTVCLPMTLREHARPALPAPSTIPATSVLRRAEGILRPTWLSVDLRPSLLPPEIVRQSCPTKPPGAASASQVLSRLPTGLTGARLYSNGEKNLKVLSRKRVQDNLATQTMRFSIARGRAERNRTLELRKLKRQRLHTRRRAVNGVHRTHDNDGNDDDDDDDDDDGDGDGDDDGDDDDEEEEEEEEETETNRPRKRRGRCGECNKFGHYAPTCPEKLVL